MISHLQAINVMKELIQSIRVYPEGLYPRKEKEGPDFFMEKNGSESSAGGSDARGGGEKDNFDYVNHTIKGEEEVA